MTPEQGFVDQRPGPASLLKARAATVALPFPVLLAQAEQLVQIFLAGGHGRRRAGQGEEFWQYRPAQAGDAARSIDWRRSAQSDGHFVREQEWQTAQSVYIWCDRSSAMHFASSPQNPAKSERAAVLSLAVALLLMKGGERVALLSHAEAGEAIAVSQPKTGALHTTHLAQALVKRTPTYSDPDVSMCNPHAKAMFMSDFLGPIDGVEQAVEQAVARGIKGVLLQVIDPVEEAFPYEGRAIFETMDASLRYETLKANDLKDRYLTRLSERQNHLQRLAAAAGWQFQTFTTQGTEQMALLWLFQALEGRQR